MTAIILFNHESRALIGNDFMFFDNRIILIRGNILHITDYSSTGYIKGIISPDVCLEIFHLTELHELTTTLSSFKSSTCILDPVPTGLLKEVLPLVSNQILNIIHLSLVTGYVPQSFIVAVINHS